MGINTSQQVYVYSYNTFGRPVTFTPKMSQPTALAFLGRGIYSTQPIDVLAEDNSTFSDTRTILDVLEQEFLVVPITGDLLNIPASNEGMPALGDFEVIETKSNGGGETSLSLRKIMVSRP